MPFLTHSIPHLPFLTHKSAEPWYLLHLLLPQRKLML